jgi:hypothetical protein
MFSVYFSVEGLINSEAFQAMTLDIDLGPGLTPATGGNAFAAYGPSAFASTHSFDPPPPGPGGGGAAPLWNQNSEAGNQFDLQDLTFIAAQVPAVNLNPGEQAPYYLGDFFLNFDGLQSSSIAIRNNTGDVWAYWPGPSGSAVLVAGDTIAPATFAITVVPEPGSVIILSMAGVGLALARRYRTRR